MDTVNRLKMKISLLIIAILLYGCSKEIDTIQLIRKGKHSIEGIALSRSDGHLEYSFTFREHHKYLQEEYSDHLNKMPGLSTNRIHNNSVRIGWKQVNDNFHLYAYIYKDGNRHETKMYEAEVDELLFINIDTRKNIEISINEAVYLTDGKECKNITNFYFGGEPTAPKDLIFNIEIQ